MSQFEHKDICKWVQEHIDAYLDGDLDPTETATLNTHIAGCPSCSEELDLAQRVKEELGSLPEQLCPDTVVDTALEKIGVRDSVQTTPTRKPWKLARALQGWRLAAVAAILICLVINLTFLRQREPGKSEVAAGNLMKTEQQVMTTFAYMGYVGYETAHTIRDDVFQQKVVPPLKRALDRVFQTRVLPLKYSNS